MHKGKLHLTFEGKHTYGGRTMVKIQRSSVDEDKLQMRELTFAILCQLDMIG